MRAFLLLQRNKIPCNFSLRLFHLYFLCGMIALFLKGDLSYENSSLDNDTGS